jgi:uncharacterized membrane protein (GlpM family)
MDLFWTMVLITFGLGALVVSGATILGERLGTRIGGLIGTLPHLIIIALYFIGETQTPQVASVATVTVPVTMGINALFLFVFYSVARWNRYLASVISLGIWGLMALPMVLLGFDDLNLSVLLYILLVLLAYYLFEKRTKVIASKRSRMRYTPSVLIARGILGGGIIALAVVVAKYMGPVLGGIFSVFPALFLSTMLVYTFEHGAEYAGAMAKTMSIGGTSVVVYAFAGHFLFPIYGMALGSLIAFVEAALTAMALYPLVHSMK